MVKPLKGTQLNGRTACRSIIIIWTGNTGIVVSVGPLHPRKLQMEGHVENVDLVNIENVTRAEFVAWFYA